MSKELKRISDFVEAQTGISEEEMRSKSREKILVNARMLFSYLAKKTFHSLTATGNYINRDHTSIMNLLKRANNNEKIEKLSQGYIINRGYITDTAIKNISTNNQRKWGSLYKLWGGKCAICGFDEVIEVHHIIPRRIGGTDELENLIVLCPNHHSLADRGMIVINKLRERIDEVINKNIELSTPL